MKTTTPKQLPAMLPNSAPSAAAARHGRWGRRTMAACTPSAAPIPAIAETMLRSSPGGRTEAVMSGRSQARENAQVVRASCQKPREVARVASPGHKARAIGYLPVAGAAHRKLGRQLPLADRPPRLRRCPAAGSRARWRATRSPARWSAPGSRPHRRNRRRNRRPSRARSHRPSRAACSRRPT